MANLAKRYTVTPITNFNTKRMIVEVTTTGEDFIPTKCVITNSIFFQAPELYFELGGQEVGSMAGAIVAATNNDVRAEVQSDDRKTVQFRVTFYSDDTPALSWLDKAAHAVYDEVSHWEDAEVALCDPVTVGQSAA